MRYEVPPNERVLEERLRSADHNHIFRTAAHELTVLMSTKRLTPVANRDDLQAVSRGSNVLRYTFDLMGNKLGNPDLAFGPVPTADHFTVIDQPYIGANGERYHPLPKYLPHHVTEAYEEMDAAYKKHMDTDKEFQDKPPRPGLIIQSGYRSPYYQFAVSIKTIGREGLDHTAKAMTVPGKSQHHDTENTALDINPIGNWKGVWQNPDGPDLGFEQTPEFKWLIKHAPDFGFWFPYFPNPQDPTAEVGREGILVEPWHLQFVGKDKAGDYMEQHKLRELFTIFTNHGATH